MIHKMKIFLLKDYLLLIVLSFWLIVEKQNVQKQIAEIFSKTEETVNSQIKAATLISQKYEHEKVEKEKIMQEMQKKKKNIKDMSATIQSFKLNLNRQEQNSRGELLVNSWVP